MTDWLCPRCGEVHGDLPMHYGAPAPALWFTIPEDEREQRCLLSSDLCLIDEQYAFIVGNLEIPVIDHTERFSWDVWVSVSLPNFQRMFELWDQPGREQEPPYFGWISTTLPGYPQTLHLKALVHTREPGRRPFIKLEPTDHPLAVEQQQGIDLARIQQIAEHVRHG